MKKNKIVCILFLLFITQVKAQVVNVADYGIKPGKDVTFEVNKLLVSLKGKKGITMFFPKGKYEFYPENAFEQYRAVTNHDNSLKRIAFPIFGFQDFTIDGNGSTFNFHGKICPIIVERSKGTVLKNIKIDWEHSFVNELKVIENNSKENSFVALINDGKYGFEVKDNEIRFNHYDWQDVIGQNIAFDPATKAPIWNTRNYALRASFGKSKVVKINDKTAKFIKYTKKTPPVGTVFATYGPSPGGNRFAQAIHLSNSRDNFIENVTVYAAGGMALIAERCENITIDKLNVTSREDRYFATRADATHFLGCKGLIKMENSVLEHMMDDGINVHGAYVKVEKYMGNNTFLCEVSHVQQAGIVFSEPGDKVALISRETILPIYKTTVIKTQKLNEKRFLLTVSQVPKELPSGLLSFENLTWNPDLYMSNNTIRNNRARAALITTKGKVMIENNYFSSQMHGILIEGDNNKWYESGAVKDITIRNNTFENIGYGDGAGYPLYISPLLTSTQKLGAFKYHSNIRFTNNTLKSYNGLLTYAKSVKGLYLEGNTIELSNKYPVGTELPSIVLDYCEDVVIEKNKFKNFNWPIKIDQKENSTDVIVKKNIGIK
ncbi:right-handed parallel beta-helix repeat-containing protein [Wenyingzhuangia sp. 2_MG-2023]|uniref:alpha-1,3-galactosidase-related protein n=1 Tax=Wenyingzhuangia sp. 2_MG-2023 TaxID=3062639 RepID=UPI0026E2BE49|nr:right-handed parallel beta-helix repeat-containing protein [Wenyingzhuangia sp. 2_MG-2023]MDO6737018.1 right-handed parallel beta-helix repeat-containing protein [Wenyingzhuangia sp. 2_MG-2023]